jgi:hypothetical protein
MFDSCQEVSAICKESARAPMVATDPAVTSQLIELNYGLHF